MSDTATSRAIAAPSPLLLGHRGCRGEVAENTIAAFDHAMAFGCDGFEFDVRLTGDGKPIICHDVRLHGTTVSRAIYSNLLNHNVNKNRTLIRRRLRGEVCCLDDVLAQYGDKAFLYIELKVAGVEEIVIESLKRHSPRRFVIASFLLKVVERVHALSPDLPIGFIFDNLGGLRRWRKLPVTHVMPNHRLVTERRVREMHEAGKQVMTWTVNSPRKMRQLAEWGIDGIVSDDPVLLRNTLRGDRLAT